MNEQSDIGQPPAPSPPTAPSATMRGQDIPYTPGTNPVVKHEQRELPKPPQNPNGLNNVMRMLGQQQAQQRSTISMLAGLLMGMVFNSLFLSKLTDVNPSNGNQFAWQEETNESAAIVDFSGGRKCTSVTDPRAATALNGGIANVGDYVLMIEIQDVGAFTYQFISLPAGLFPCQVVKDGGADGTTTAGCAYTYSVLLYGGLSVMNNKSGTPVTNLAPLIQGTLNRPNGKTNPAHHGIGFFDVSGNVQLIYVDEYPVCTVCTPATTGGPTHAFADAGARAGDTPSFVGQLGFQIDTGTLYASTAVTVGSWTAV